MLPNQLAAQPACTGVQFCCSVVQWVPHDYTIAWKPLQRSMEWPSSQTTLPTAPAAASPAAPLVYRPGVDQIPDELVQYRPPSSRPQSDAQALSALNDFFASATGEWATSRYVYLHMENGSLSHYPNVRVEPVITVSEENLLIAGDPTIDSSHSSYLSESPCTVSFPLRDARYFDLVEFSHPVNTGPRHPLDTPPCTGPYGHDWLAAESNAQIPELFGPRGGPCPRPPRDYAAVSRAARHQRAASLERMRQNQKKLRSSSRYSMCAVDRSAGYLQTTDMAVSYLSERDVNRPVSIDRSRSFSGCSVGSGSCADHRQPWHKSLDCEIDCPLGPRRAEDRFPRFVSGNVGLTIEFKSGYQIFLAFPTWEEREEFIASAQRAMRTRGLVASGGSLEGMAASAGGSDAETGLGPVSAISDEEGEMWRRMQSYHFPPNAGTVCIDVKGKARRYVVSVCAATTMPMAERWTAGGGASHRPPHLGGMDHLQQQNQLIRFRRQRTWLQDILPAALRRGGKHAMFTVNLVLSRLKDVDEAANVFILECSERRSELEPGQTPSSMPQEPASELPPDSVATVAAVQTPENPALVLRIITRSQSERDAWQRWMVARGATKVYATCAPPRTAPILRSLEGDEEPQAVEGGEVAGESPPQPPASSPPLPFPDDAPVHSRDNATDSPRKARVSYRWEPAPDTSGDDQRQEQQSGGNGAEEATEGANASPIRSPELTLSDVRASRELEPLVESVDRNNSADGAADNDTMASGANAEDEEAAGGHGMEGVAQELVVAGDAQLTKETKKSLVEHPEGEDGGHFERASPTRSALSEEWSEAEGDPPRCTSAETCVGRGGSVLSLPQDPLSEGAGGAVAGDAAAELGSDDRTAASPTSPTADPEGGANPADGDSPASARAAANLSAADLRSLQSSHESDVNTPDRVSHHDHQLTLSAAPSAGATPVDRLFDGPARVGDGGGSSDEGVPCDPEVTGSVVPDDTELSPADGTVEPAGTPIQTSRSATAGLLQKEAEPEREMPAVGEGTPVATNDLPSPPPPLPLKQTGSIHDDSGVGPEQTPARGVLVASLESLAEANRTPCTPAGDTRTTAAVETAVEMECVAGPEQDDGAPALHPTGGSTLRSSFGSVVVPSRAESDPNGATTPSGYLHEQHFDEAAVAAGVGETTPAAEHVDTEHTSPAPSRSSNSSPLNFLASSVPSAGGGTPTGLGHSFFSEATDSPMGDTHVEADDTKDLLRSTATDDVTERIGKTVLPSTLEQRPIRLPSLSPSETEILPPMRIASVPLYEFRRTAPPQTEEGALAPPVHQVPYLEPHSEAKSAPFVSSTASILDEDRELSAEDEWTLESGAPPQKSPPRHRGPLAVATAGPLFVHGTHDIGDEWELKQLEQRKAIFRRSIQTLMDPSSMDT